jgi:uncharacterized membrane protein YdjX (TVP38/TMEM64 family)
MSEDDYLAQETSYRQLGVALVLFAASCGVLFVVFSQLPPLSPAEKARVFIPPRSLEQIQALAEIGSKYTTNYYYTVMLAIALLYTFLQAFSIPGSIGLSFVSGALFGVPVGFPLVIFCATLGPTISYGLSHLIGRAVVRRVFPSQMRWFAGQVDKRRRNLFNFLLFLRITPFLPNFFINLASPLLGVPLKSFIIATMFGIMPATFMHVSAGKQIQEMSEMGSQLNVTKFVLLSLLGVVVLLPTWGPVQTRLDKLLNRGASVVDEAKQMKKNK